MGRLTTHVLDTAHGRPAVGVWIELWRIDGERILVAQTQTNADGRADGPLLEGEAFTTGTYELVFGIGDYFALAGAEAEDATPRQAVVAATAFLRDVPVRFTVSDASAHYHVPLLASLWSYTTYRGS